MGQSDGCYKIGKSANPRGRLAGLDSGSPSGLAIEHLMPTADMGWLERFLHVAFHHRRVRGEWFRLADDEVEAIRTIPAANTPAALPATIVALHEKNLEAVARPKSKKRAGWERVLVELPDRWGPELRRLARAAGVSVNTVIAQAVAGTLGETFDPPKRGRPPKPAAPPKKRNP